VLRRSSLVCIAIITLLGIGPASTRTATAAPGSLKRCFSETGFCIEGQFLAFWDANGGLPVFGYPITPARDEVNRDSGQRYLTQWFERTRFELHLENPDPYTILLGRLGDDVLRQGGVDWTRQPRETGAQQRCLWFPQTSHAVCDQGSEIGFKTYWLTHGLRQFGLDPYQASLLLFGAPLTAATVETNPMDGKPYLTQWFERARFEWHPDEPDQYKVLLGLLGRTMTSRPTDCHHAQSETVWKEITPGHCLCGST